VSSGGSDDLSHDYVGRPKVRYRSGRLAWPPRRRHSAVSD